MVSINYPENREGVGTRTVGGGQGQWEGDKDNGRWTRTMGGGQGFNKIAIPNKYQMASGQGSHWRIESPKMFSSMCSPPLSNICHFYF